MACALAAAVFATGLVGSSGPVLATPGATGPATTSLAWAHCGGGFECARLAVPVDYANAAGGDLSLAVIRRPADDRARRVGTLVINYGGPGDPGTETLRIAAGHMPAVVRHRFDLVSFDPRGTGGSRPVDCLDDRTFAHLWSEDRTPNSDADLPRFYDGTAFSVDLVGECVARTGAWLAHVGTRNVARDLDRLRTALGEARLDYLGYSYGTVIGAVYARDFPGNVGALVLDGPVDLSSSVTRQQRANAAGFERALGQFLRECSRHTPCAFAPDADPPEQLEALRARLEGGARLRASGGRTVGVTEFYMALLSALYSPALWPYLTSSLAQAELGDGTGLQTLSDFYAGRRADGSYSNLQEALGVIVCDDQPEPLVSYETFRSDYARFVRDFPFFGPLLGGTPLGCDPRLPRPRPDEVIGDVRTTRAQPILVIGTTNDPVTPYPGAVDLVRRLAGSRLLTVEGTRHGSYAEGGRCVDRLVDRYLISGQLPHAGSRCARL
jgi:pimeloyl-ACP methyl ester carboxylesterase